MLHIAAMHRRDSRAVLDFGILDPGFETQGVCVTAVTAGHVVIGRFFEAEVED